MDISARFRFTIAIVVETVILYFAGFSVIIRKVNYPARNITKL